MRTISSLMTADPVLVNTETRLTRVAALMEHHSIRHIPVTNDSEQVVGLITDFDLLAVGTWAYGSGWQPRRDSLQLTAKDLCKLPAETCDSEDSLPRALAMLAASESEAVLVVDADGRSAGIVTEHDGVRLAEAELSGLLSTRHEGSVPVMGVTPWTLAVAALEVMAERRVRHLLLIDDNEMVGVVSWRDLVAQNLQKGAQLPVDHFATKAVHSVADQTSLGECARLMVAHKIGCLPVVDQAGRPVAIVTRTDIILALVAALELEESFPADPTAPGSEFSD